tara:strand:- start:255 stop:638 length:384 start_codon:yes stop_codon:yes gene_type:complete
MAGTLTTNVVKDVYKKLSFHKIAVGETLGQLYTDNGSADVAILDLDNIQTEIPGVTSTLSKFEYKTSTINSDAVLFQLKNNTNSRFTVHGDGVVALKAQASVPTIGNYSGGSLYSDGQYLYLASDDS